MSKTTQPNQTERYLTTEEVANLFGISKRMVLRLAAENKLPDPIILGRRTYRWSPTISDEIKGIQTLHRVTRPVPSNRDDRIANRNA